MIKGVALLAFCFIIGQLMGEYLGNLIGINANIGGVGFAMLLLIFSNNWLEKRGLQSETAQSGIQFWSNMYIPIIVAMAATQNVKAAVSSGLVAIIAGVVPVIACFYLVYFLGKKFKNQ